MVYSLADCKKKYGVPVNDPKTPHSQTNSLHLHDLVTVTGHYNIWQDQELSELGTQYMTNKDNKTLKITVLLKYLTTFLCSSADNLEVNYTVHLLIIHVYTFHILSKEQHPNAKDI